MKQLLNIFCSLALITSLALSSCGGDSSSSSGFVPLDESGPTPDFNPSANESLDSLYLNTFTSNGTNLTTDIQSIDFNNVSSAIEKGDEVKESFVLKNDSSSDLTVTFSILGGASGFSVTNQQGQSIHGWKQITLSSGDLIDLTAVFNAFSFGTQTTAIMITTNEVSGYIQLPLRAQVNGGGAFKIISAAYSCDSTTSPRLKKVDFEKVISGKGKTKQIKICNKGGEDIRINKINIQPALNTTNVSDFFDSVTSYNLWNTNDQIFGLFSFGQTPTHTQPYTAPDMVDYTGSLIPAQNQFTVHVTHSHETPFNLNVAAGKILTLDVEFAPALMSEAPENTLYNPVPINADMILDTTLGEIRIPMFGATAGIEPELSMAYRLEGSTAWIDVDLTSDSPAMNFETVSLFKDWVSNNSKTIEVRLLNSGSGNKSLELFSENPTGFFEYIWKTKSPLAFPIILRPTQSKIIRLRYLPSASDELDNNFVSQWNFGQLQISHNGGNGPSNILSLIGEQEAGYAVELKLGGSALDRIYDENIEKNLCLIRADANNPSKKTFTVINNNKNDILHVNWTVDYNTQDFSLAQSSGSFTVAPNSQSSSTDLALSFVGNSQKIDQSVSGVLHVSTNFGSKESQYASLLNEVPEGRTFEVPFKAQISETGESPLCDTGILGDPGRTRVTFIMDRVTMGLPPSLPETNRNPPAFKFHLPLDIDLEKGTVRIAEDVPFIYDVNDPRFSAVKQIRSYVHQASNVQGCAPIPATPYRLEFEKGSWLGTGSECSDDGPGSVTFQTVASDPRGSQTVRLDTDTACADNNGAEEWVDPQTGQVWVVFYSDFYKIENCEVQYYGRIATFAFKKGVETIADVFQRAEQKPNESEAYYENIYGSYRFGSFISFPQATTCGTINKAAGETISNDPDAVKSFYTCLSTLSNTKRNDGYIAECAYFNFAIDQGTIPEDADATNPDYDSWTGYGTYEPHVDEKTGRIIDTKYDITLYNAHMKAFVIGASDRTNFFGHPGHLVYSDIYATLTTKTTAPNKTNWQERLAVKVRPHFNFNQVYLKANDPLDIGVYWTHDGMASEHSNVIDNSTIIREGESFNGQGKGNFRYTSGARDEIVPAGWPVNYDENNLLVMVALGAFTGQGNTAPSFTKADAATGKGKALYFTFKGCLVAGNPDESQGCYDYRLDNVDMPNNPGQSSLEAYNEAGLLPDGIISSAAECQLLADPGFEDRMDYLYIPCVNYKIFPIDRDRMTNLFAPNSQRFEFEDNSYYNNSECGFGM